MKTYDLQATGKRIRDLRKGRNLTQEALAGVIGIDTKSMSRIECGGKGCSVDTLVVLSEFFQVSMDYLVMGEASSLPDVGAKLDNVILELTTIRNSFSARF